MVLKNNSSSLIHCLFRSYRESKTILCSINYQAFSASFIPSKSLRINCNKISFTNYDRQRSFSFNSFFYYLNITIIYNFFNYLFDSFSKKETMVSQNTGCILALKKPKCPTFLTSSESDSICRHFTSAFLYCLCNQSTLDLGANS